MDSCMLRHWVCKSGRGRLCKMASSVPGRNISDTPCASGGRNNKLATFEKKTLASVGAVSDGRAVVAGKSCKLQGPLGEAWTRSDSFSPSAQGEGRGKSSMRPRSSKAMSPFGRVCTKASTTSPSVSPSARAAGAAKGNNFPSRKIGFARPADWLA